MYYVGEPEFNTVFLDRLDENQVAEILFNDENILYNSSCV